VQKDKIGSKGISQVRAFLNKTGILLFLLSFIVYGCGGDGGGGVTQTAPVATCTINLSGGAGVDGVGGNGGNIDALKGYFDIKISQSGTVDTSFTVPTYPTPIDLGTEPLIVATNTTINVIPPEGDDPAAKTPYMVSGDKNLYISDDDGMIADEPPVTGIQVNAGVTLIPGLNMNTDGNTGQDMAQINLANDFYLLGTIKTKDLTTGTVGGGVVDTRHGETATIHDKGSLSINAYRIVMATTGKIDISGDDATGAEPGRGGDGGSLSLSAKNGGVFLNGGSIDTTGGNGLGTNIGGFGAGIYISSDSVLINRAPIDSSGGNGTTGGESGYIEFDASQSIYNTAMLRSNGGVGSAGAGGAASTNGGIYMYSSSASIYNSAELITNGGNGTTGGGNGGCIDIYGAEDTFAGNITNSGNISANGGYTTTNGNGGDGGTIYFVPYGGSMKTSGAITANGGTCPGASSVGGSGGSLEISSYKGKDYKYTEEIAPGPIQVTGNISLKGGGGSHGGSGGHIKAENHYSSDDFRPTGTIEFIGYNGSPIINLNGGDGTKGGGNGGGFFAYTEDANFGGMDQPTGSIFNDVSIVAKGGAATVSGNGGHGGHVEMEAEGNAYATSTKLINSGSLDASGGNGVDNGGSSGGIYFYGHDLAQNTGAITANGGNASATTGTGGRGADDNIEIISSYDVLNTGFITANGGTGTGTNASGGDSHFVSIYAGNKVTNSGNIYGNGGNAMGTGTNGDGGIVDLFSEKAVTVNTAALISVVKGSGGNGIGPPDPMNGHIYIDWVDVTPIDGTLP